MGTLFPIQWELRVKVEISLNIPMKAHDYCGSKDDGIILQKK